MNKIIIYCYPKCSTCQKAVKYLEKHNLSFDYHNIKEDQPNFNELKSIIARSGKDINKFFNTSGQLYKLLDLKNKLTTMTDNDKIKLLAGEGMLIKRPLVLIDDTVLLGFKETEWDEVLK